MGGCWRALNALGIPPGPASGIKMTMLETDPPARAVFGAKAGKSEWFHLSSGKDESGEVGSVLALTDDKCRLLLTTLDRYKEVTHVLFAGGSPCQGFSRAKPQLERSARLAVRPHLGLPRPVIGRADAPQGKGVGGGGPRERRHEGLRHREEHFQALRHRPPGRQREPLDGMRPGSELLVVVPRVPPPDMGRTYPDFDAILSQAWRPLWEFSGSGRRPRFFCFLRPWLPNGPPEYITSFWKFSLHRYDEHGRVYRPDAPAEILKKIEGLVEGIRSNDRGFKKTGTAIHSSRSDLCRRIHAEVGEKYLRPPNADERDLALGFPAGASRLLADVPQGQAR